jgi:aspartyl protease family protein
VTGDQRIDLLFYGLMILLPLMALIRRRPPFVRTMMSALAWVAIFAVGLLVVQQREQLTGFTRFLTDQQVVGDETRIRQSGDGHFWADVSINGVERRMLVDSGATTTALSVETARAAGIDTGRSPFPAVLNTANGQVAAETGRADRVQIGSIVAKDLGVVVSPAFGDTNVIGMNFLSQLHSWRVEGGTLILQPDPPREPS